MRCPALCPILCLRSGVQASSTQSATTLRSALKLSCIVKTTCDLQQVTVLLAKSLRAGTGGKGVVQQAGGGVRFPAEEVCKLVMFQSCGTISRCHMTDGGKHMQV